MGVGMRGVATTEEEKNEIGNRKRRLGEDGENIVAGENGRKEDKNGTVFSKECKKTFKSRMGGNKCCNPCGEMRKKLSIKKVNLKISKRRKLNRPMIRCGGIYRMDADELTLEAFKFYRKRFGRKVKKKENGVYHSWKCEGKFEKDSGTRIRCNECAKYSKKIKMKKDSLTRKRKRET